MVTKFATNLNGISIAYVMGVANAAFACLIAFGVTLSPEEAGSLATLLNAILILTVHIGHRVGEATASGSSMMSSNQAFGTPPTTENTSGKG